MRLVGKSISLMRNSSPKSNEALAHTLLVEILDLL